MPEDGLRNGLRNGLTVTDVKYNIRSSTNRLPEHRMVPAEVCDSREQARPTSDGRELDLTTRQYAHTRDARVTV